MFTQEEINKLPKWAQNRCNKLTADIEYYKKQLRQVNGEDTTNIFIDKYPTPQPLPGNSNILFVLPNGKITCNVNGNALNIHAQYNNHYEMGIKPKVSNGVEIIFYKP